MNVMAFLFALSAATVAISGAFGSNGHIHLSRRLQQNGAGARTQICNNGRCTTIEEGQPLGDLAAGGNVQCMADCAALSSGQVECMEACSGEDASNSVSTVTTPGSTGSSRSVSCENGKCKVQECDPSGCTVSETDADAVAGESFSGVNTGRGGTSSSATVSASSGPGGVQTDVQTSGDGASASATASNGTVTETTACEGADCETNTDGGASGGGGVQNSLGGGSTTSGDAGEVSTEPEVQGEDTSGSPPVRGQTTPAPTRPVSGPLTSRGRKRRRNRGFGPAGPGRIVSRSTSCASGVCTTTECTADGQCSVRRGGRRPPLRGRVRGRGRGRAPPPNTRRPLGRVVSRSRACSNGVCTTRACDAQGRCRTTRDAPPGPRSPPPRAPVKPPPARPSRPVAPVAPPRASPVVPQSSPTPDGDAIGRIVSRSRSCSNGICTSQECDAQGNCRTSTRRLQDDDDTTPTDPPSPPQAPISPPPEPTRPPEAPARPPVTTSISDPPADDTIGRIVSRSRSCSNGVCSTLECDAQGKCRTQSDSPPGDDATSGDPTGRPTTPEISPEASPGPPSPPPPQGGAIGRIVSRSRSCTNGVCTTLECDAQGNCRTPSDVPPVANATPVDPQSPPAVPASPPPPQGEGDAIGRIVSRSRSCNNGVCTTLECDAQGNCRTSGDAPRERDPIGRIVSRSRSCSNGVCTSQECDAQGNCRTSTEGPPARNTPVDPVSPPDEPPSPTVAPAAPPTPAGDTIGRIVSRSRSCSNGVCSTRECDAQGKCRSSRDLAGVRPAVAGLPAGPATGRFGTASGVRGTVTASANGTSTDIQTFGPGARANATASNGTATQTATCTGGECVTTTTRSLPVPPAPAPPPAAPLLPLPPVAVGPVVLEAGAAEEPGMGPEADAEAPGPDLGLEVSDVEAPGPAGEAPADVTGAPQVVVRGGSLGNTDDLVAPSAGADAGLGDDSAAAGLVRSGRAVAAAILSIALLATV